MKHDNNAELLPLVDSEGNVIGSATRGECHNGTMLLHPVVHLHLFDTKRRLYLQKRPAWKEIQPGKWDTAVGGHVDYGEDIATALRREAAEELGLNRFEAEQISRYLFQSDRECELVYTFCTTVSPKDIHPSDEVDCGRWWSIEEMQRDYRQLTPNLLSELPLLFPEFILPE